MILKAGTYRFKNAINVDNIVFDDKGTFTQLFDSSVGFTCADNDYLSMFFVRDNTTFALQYVSLGVQTIAYVSEDMEGLSAGWQDTAYQTITINKDTEVDDTFGTWYIANTNYNEVNAKPLAEITYNGETIAQLNAGETATLSCKDKKMASDVVVKVNEVEGGGECSGNHIIEVDELPTENIDKSAVYELNQPFNDVIVVMTRGSSTNVIPISELASEGGFSCNTIPTKTADNIQVTDMSTTYHFYYIEDENDIFVYGDFEGTGVNVWASVGTGLGMGSYNGAVSDVNQATADGYYMLGGSSYHKYVNGTWEKIIYESTITSEEITVTPTKQTQEITATNALYISKATVNPIPDNYVAVSGTKEIAENGTYDVNRYASATVNVKGIIEVTKLPTENIREDAVYSMDGGYKTIEEETILGIWRFKDTIDFSLSGDFSCSFRSLLSSSVNFVAFRFVTADGVNYFTYKRGTGATNAWNSDSGWNTSLKEVVITEAPTDETFITWLKANADKIKAVDDLYRYVNGDWEKYIDESTVKPLPTEISTESEMTALLETAEVGAIYKYVGETTDTYENGALYVVEESGE